MPKNTFFIFVLCAILLLPFCLCGQTMHVSYKQLWNLMNADSITKDKKIEYLDQYIEKAQDEKNSLEEYRALEKKTYLLPFNQAIVLLHKMNPLVEYLKNDSLSGDFLNRSTTLYYKNRYFKEALDYAIQAEKFNEQINNEYNLNACRIDIGNIYYHTKNYQKAKLYFIRANAYYKDFDNYNHIQGYISSLYSLGKCYWKLEEFNALQKTIKESESALSKLTPEDKKIETAYLNYIKAGYAFLNKDYHTALTYLKSALPIIQENEDVTNEYVIYLYLGKILWAQNNKKEAVVYFLKIDELFQENKFLNYELREAYSFLNTYYKENNEIALQLKATESLIVLNQQFEKEQQYITDVLHYKLDTQRLETEKTILQNQLNKKVYFNTSWKIAVGVCVIFIAFFVWKRRKKTNNTTKLSHTVPLKDSQVTHENEPLKGSVDYKLPKLNFENVATNVAKVSSVKSEEKLSNKDEFSTTEKRLLEQLAIFEKEKEFKKSITLDQLALQLGTNRTTLSNFLNTHKGGYVNYFSKLRVHEVVHDLKKNKNLHKSTLQELAASYGFSNTKAFSSQFKAEIGVSPIVFIRNIANIN